MKILIIGAVAAGATLATNLRKLSEECEIILLEKGRDTSFKNCEIPYFLSHMVEDSKDLIARSPDQFRNNNIDARVYHKALTINRKEKYVEILDIKNDKIYKENYDKLVIATGASPFIPTTIKGLDKKRKNVFKIEDVVDVENIRSYIEENKVKNIIVNGAGFIGLEACENLNELDNVRVSLVVRDRVLSANIDEELAGFVEDNLKNHIELIKNDEIVEVEDYSLKFKSGNKISYDILINAIGIRANSKIAKEAGLTLTKSEAIDTDRNFLTNDPDIYAIGDVIEVYNPLTKTKNKLNLAWPSHRQAKFVAKNILGIGAKSEKFIGSFALRSFDMNIASTGLNKKILDQAKIPYESTLIRHNDSVDVLPYSKPMNMKIFFDSYTGKIYGIQAVGEGDVVKRIDIVAGLIGMAANIYDLEDSEFAYQPIFSTPNDALNVLASQAIDVFEGKIKHINLENLENVIHDFKIIDIRDKDSFKKSHIKNAINIENKSLRETPNQLKKDEKILLYCFTGNTTKSLAKFLQNKGYNNIYILDGGFMFMEKYNEIKNLDLIYYN